MTDIGELVNVDVIVDVNHDDETCYFCRSKKKPVEETNDLVDHPDEDADGDGIEAGVIKFHNNSGKLTQALGGPKESEWVKVGSKSETLEVSSAAHHLIPGNAALKKSTLFKSEKYLWTDGKAMGNIGYNVNSKPNGVFLPGNYAQRPWGADGAGFKGRGLDPKEYAFAAIEKCRAQFHDAHPDYSDFVMQALNKLHDKLEAKQDIWCPDGKKQEDEPENRSPLYVLVNRLHTISARMDRMLTAPSKSSWKRNIFTSRFSEQYMSERLFK